MVGCLFRIEKSVFPSISPMIMRLLKTQGSSMTSFSCCTMSCGINKALGVDKKLVCVIWVERWECHKIAPSVRLVGGTKFPTIITIFVGPCHKPACHNLPNGNGQSQINISPMCLTRCLKFMKSAPSCRRLTCWRSSHYPQVSYRPDRAS
ncbi:MAG: hypothetical protein ACI9SB_001405 [Candidatus Azotimanducaceae bacterium]